MINVDVLLKCNNILGEGITWSNEYQTLFWLDISNNTKIYKFNLDNFKSEIFERPEIINI